MKEKTNRNRSSLEQATTRNRKGEKLIPKNEKRIKNYE